MMKNSLTKILTLFVVIFSLIYTQSCKREMSSRLWQPDTTKVKPPPPPDTPKSALSSIKPPAGFNYNTVTNKVFQITINGLDNNPVPYALVLLMDNSIEANGKIILKGAANANGVFVATVDLPTYYKKIVFNTNFLGVPKNIILNISGSTVQSYTIGGSGLNQYETVPNNGTFLVNGKKNLSKFSSVLGKWNSATGFPDYLQSTTSIPFTFYNNIGELLPERIPLPGRKDDLLDDALTRRTINVTAACDVYVTFVNEGSNNNNVLFYYTYPTNSPPVDINNIDSLYIVYPNASFNKSGGAMAGGNKVILGSFLPGTTIAYGIASNGWQGGTNGINGVTTGNYLLFANANLNPETGVNEKQHAIAMFDPTGELFITAFEDTRRDDNKCDNDFNDLIVYTEAIPSGSLESTGFVFLPPAADADGDNITDMFDEFKGDAGKAFTNYYPNSVDAASVMFEDNWPSLGDFDMNDVVVDFRYKLITDANNLVKNVEGFYTLRASGSNSPSSFAVEFPTLRSNITAFGGGVLEGTSANACVRLFSSSRIELFEWNTKPGIPYSDTVNYLVKFSLINPVSLSIFGLGQYNPFIWSLDNGRDRGYEVHLPGKNYTNLADVTIFRTKDDNTQTTGTDTYRSKNNLFWALSTPQRFNYNFEATDITQSYLKFVQWANSGGIANPDWYKPQPGYRDNSKIYTKP